MQLALRNHSYVTILRATLLVFISAQASSYAYAAGVAKSAYIQPEKGLMISSDVIKNNLPRPTFDELRRARFTMIGTGHANFYGEYELTVTLNKWFKSVHAAGFRTFLQIQADYLTALSQAKIAATLAIDVIELDEPLDKLKFTKAQLLKVLDSGLSKNPRLQFVITEYSTNGITYAYDWTSEYPQVRVATDNYDQKGQIDLGIQLAQKYNKRPLVWLIFVPGSIDFDCYRNLDNWIAYAKARGVDILSFKVKPDSSNSSKWGSILNY